MLAATENETEVVMDVVARLAPSFTGIPTDALHDTVRDCYHQFAGSRIRDFIPILVERMARAKLLAGVSAVPGHHPRVILAG